MIEKQSQGKVEDEGRFAYEIVKGNNAAKDQLDQLRLQCSNRTDRLTPQHKP